MCGTYSLCDTSSLCRVQCEFREWFHCTYKIHRIHVTESLSNHTEESGYTMHVNIVYKTPHTEIY